MQPLWSIYQLLVCFWKNKPNIPPLKLNNHPTEVVKSAKSLGVILNDHLKWNEHVGQIVKKASKCLYMLGLLKRACADTKTLLPVYVSCIRPVMEYGAQAWLYNLPHYLCMELERIQLRAMRIIDSSLSYTDVLTKYHLPTRRDLLCTSFSRKNVLQQSDTLSELVQYERNFNYDQRFQNKLVHYSCRTNRFKNSYIPSSIEIFNVNCKL